MDEQSQSHASQSHNLADKSPQHIRRSTHIRAPPRSHDSYVRVDLAEFFIATTEEGSEQLSFQEAQYDLRWISAMQSEFNSILKNNSWDLVPLPPRVCPISARWIYKVKLGINGGPARHKARIVACGFEQQHGVNFQETFASTIWWESIRLVIGLAEHHSWPIYHMDVATEFLNRYIHDDVFMLQPPRCITPGSEHLVCMLNWSLHGLKQSPRAWYSRIDSFLRNKGMSRKQADSNVYYTTHVSSAVMLVLYVDDLLITGSDPHAIATLKRLLQKEFKMVELSLIQKFLGVQFLQTDGGILLH